MRLANTGGPSPALQRRTGDRVLTGALLALAAGLALNTLLGPLAFDLVDYGLSESLRNQALGLEAVSLLLVAPLCLVAARLVSQARPAGAVLALAPATYTSYMAVQYVVGPGYLHYPKVLPFHLGLFVLGGVVAVRAWARIEPGHLPPMTPRTRRRRAAVLAGLAAFVVVRYLPVLVATLSEEPLAAELREEPAFFWTIVLMDLGVVVPASIATAVGLRRGSPTAAKGMCALVGWFALVPPSVAAMAIAMVVNDDPHASAASMALFLAAALAFAAYGVRIYRPFLSPHPPTPRSHENGNATSFGRLRLEARVDR